MNKLSIDLGLIYKLKPKLYSENQLKDILLTQHVNLVTNTKCVKKCTRLAGYGIKACHRCSELRCYLSVKG